MFDVQAIDRDAEGANFIRHGVAILGLQRANMSLKVCMAQVLQDWHHESFSTSHAQAINYISDFIVACLVCWFVQLNHLFQGCLHLTNLLTLQKESATLRRPGDCNQIQAPIELPSPHNTSSCRIFAEAIRNTQVLHMRTNTQ